MLWLSGWFYRKNHIINSAAGAGYQVRVTAHYGAGVDAGENVYCSSLCRTDFGDIRFTDESNNLLDYWMQSKTDGVSAVFWVEIAGSLESTSQTVYVYWGKSDASTTSNQASTFVDVIPNLQLGVPLEEADTEVNPIVIADDNQAAFWTADNYDGSIGGTIGTPTLSNVGSAPVGANMLQITGVAGSYQKWRVYHNYGSNQDWSSKQFISLYLTGTNSGKNLIVLVNKDNFTANTLETNFWYWVVPDTFTGLTKIKLWFSALQQGGGTLNLATIKGIAIRCANADTNWSYNGNVDRVIAAIPPNAIDYSGNGYNGTTTGTMIVPGRLSGKNGRQFPADGSKIVVSHAFNCPVWTVCAFFKRLGEPGSSNANYHTLVNNLMGFGNEALRVNRTSGGSHACALVQITGPAWKYASTTQSIDANFNLISAMYDDSTHSLYAALNGNISPATDTTETPVMSSTNLLIGQLSSTWEFTNGIISGVYFFSTKLSSTQLTNMSANYPDVTLDAGKVLVRKYATIQPSHDVWGGVEHFVVASDSFSVVDGILRHRQFSVSDLVGATDELLGCKGLLLSDALNVVDAVTMLKALLVSDAVGLADAVLALKSLGVADSVVLLDSVSVPLRVRKVLDSVCLADGLTVNKTLMIAEDVFVVETAEVGTGDRRTRLFLILGNLAIKLSKD